MLDIIEIIYNAENKINKAYNQYSIVIIIIICYHRISHSCNITLD